MSSPFEFIFTLFPVFVPLTILVAVLYLFNDNRDSDIIKAFITLPVVLFFVFIFFVPSLIDDFEDDECLREGWLDCEEREIPLDECDRVVEYDGPYWNEKETITYRVWGCVDYG